MLHSVEGRQEIAAHVEIELAGQQQRSPADLRTSLRFRHVEAAGGIGAVIAETFVTAGARVHTCDISGAALDALTARNPSIAAAQVDLSDEEAIADWCEQAITDLGGADVLINNAGIAGPTAAVEDISLDDWRQCLAIDLDSHFLTCRSVVPVMKTQRSGSIVNMSSTAGQVGYGRRSPYAAAKWAVIGFTKSLAIEVGPYGVRVNAICPGAVRGDRMGRVIAADDDPI